VIGRRLTESATGDQWDIVAAEHGQYILAPVEHGRGPVENVTLAALKSRFGVEAAEPPAPVDEVAAWRRFGSAWRADCWRPARGGEAAGPTPEEVFDAATPTAD